MKTVEILFDVDGKVQREKIEEFFTASKNPYYLGLIVKPSAGIWSTLTSSRTKEITLSLDGNVGDFKIFYRIEVGENSIFFLRPSNEEITQK